VESDIDERLPPIKDREGAFPLHPMGKRARLRLGRLLGFGGPMEEPLGQSLANDIRVALDGLERAAAHDGLRRHNEIMQTP
jgi:hypothetical protein